MGQGGWTYVAYEYVESAGGLETGSEYPYTATNGYCNFQKSEVVADISSWKYVTQDQDEQTMKNFVGTTGPLSICVDASSWQFYQGGVLKNCGTQIDHCVQITGYGVTDGELTGVLTDTSSLNMDKILVLLLKSLPL